MRAGDLARLVSLAAMWGGSYLFMRYAVPHFGAVLMIELRVFIAGIALAVFVYGTGGRIGWRRHWRAYLFVGAIGLALPFVLIGQALESIDASTGAILNALAPLWASIVAAIWIRDPITPAKASGIALCLLGTGVLVGWTPAPMSRAQLLGTAMLVAATIIYGYTIVFTKVHLKEAIPMSTSAATLLLAGIALLPFTPVDRDVSAIPAMAWLAVAGLALVSTTIAFIFYYRLIHDVGPVKAITTTLLVPVFGMLWGVLFLGEPLDAGRIAGCAIILAGCSLVLGLLRWPAGARRAAAASADERG